MRSTRTRNRETESRCETLLSPGPAPANRHILPSATFVATYREGMNNYRHLHCLVSATSSLTRSRCVRATISSARSGTRWHGTTKSTCPFATLGLAKSKEPSYAEVKNRFQQLALEHHPDRITATNQEDNSTHNLTSEEATMRFVRYRTAFEAIVESDDGSGSAVLREDFDFRKVMTEQSNDQTTNAASATAQHVPNYDDMSHRHIDPQVLREVAELAEDMAPGGLDKGGLWQFAASMREKAKRGDLPPLQMSVGENASETKTRRRRRKR